MKRTALSMIHERSNKDEARRKRKLSQDAEKEKTRRQEENRTTQNRDDGGDTNRTEERTKEPRRAQRRRRTRTGERTKKHNGDWQPQQIWSTTLEFCDAESKVGSKFTEVPHWESHVYNRINCERPC